MLLDEAIRTEGSCIHPVMLDLGAADLAAAMPTESTWRTPPEVTYLPVAIETIRVLGDVGWRARCRAELISVDDGGGALGRITLMNDTGTLTTQISRRLPATRTTPNIAITAGPEVFDTVWLQTSTSSEPSVGVPARLEAGWC